MASVAVVILNYNGKDYLEGFLPTIVENTPHAEIIVVDNQSSDESVSVLKKKFPEVSLIELEKNHGFAGGYNQALSQVESDYYVLLNSDIEVTPTWLEPLTNFMEQNNDYVACQPKILSYHNKNQFEYAGAAGGFIDRLGYPYCRGRILGTMEEDSGQYDNEIDIFWATGACMVIRSSVFKAHHGFDKDFFAHMEEIDLCWRLINDGWKLKFIPSSTVYHVGGGTLEKSSSFKTYLNFRNSLFAMIKNLRGIELWWKLPFRILLDWLAIFKFALEGNFKHATAILKSHRSVAMSIRKIFRKRNNPKKVHMNPFSIVFPYYLLGKKKYSEL